MDGNRLEKVTPNEVYSFRMNYDSEGRIDICGKTFRPEWIRCPVPGDKKLMSKILAECVMAAEEFEYKYKISPNRITASAISSIYLVYSRAE